MPGPARVNSIQALREFRSALAVFSDEARSAMDSASAELTRTSQRTASDLPRYWQSEQRKQEEQVVRARIALEHARSMADMGKSSVDERRALQGAKEGVDHARKKYSATKRWSRELERESTMYRGQIEPLARIIEGAIPRAMARLERMTEDLERYTTTAPPEEPHAGASVERSMATASIGTLGANGSDTETYTRLRSQAPHADSVRDAVRLGDDAPVPRITLETPDRRTLALASGEHPAPDMRLDLAIACSPVAGRFVLQRDEPADESDSGWRLHTDPPTDQWGRTQCVRVLRAIPDLASIARLPAGSVVLIENDGVRSLFDTMGREVWTHLQGPPDAPSEDPA